MNKLRVVLKYFLIAVLFIAAISSVNPVKVNAAEEGEPYESCIIIPTGNHK